MKIYYLQNDNKEITEDGFTKFNDACQEMEQEDYHIRNGYNGALFFEDYMETDEYREKARLYSDYRALYELRRQRETECFAVINRGSLWYDRLTYVQRAELADWYQAWLDVTETKIIPEKPYWLKE